MAEKQKTAGLHSGHRQRMREKYLEHGEAVFNEHQLLEMLLFYAIPRKDTNELAHELIQQFGSLEGVFRASTEELCQMKGISENAAVLLRLIPDVLRRSTEKTGRSPVLADREEAAEYLRPYFEGLRTERAYLLCVAENGRILGCDLLASGGDSEVSFEPSRIMELALRHHANWAILAHGHPSGYALPSNADINSTRRCRLLLQQVGIELRDHVVFGDGDYYSMADSPGMM